MARFYVKDFIDLGTSVYHDATTWQVAYDPEFNHIIDESIEDRINVKEWNSPLFDKEKNDYVKDQEQI